MAAIIINAVMAGENANNMLEIALPARPSVKIRRALPLSVIKPLANFPMPYTIEKLVKIHPILSFVKPSCAFNTGIAMERFWRVI